MGGGGLHMNLNNGRFKIYIYICGRYIWFLREIQLSQTGIDPRLTTRGVGTVHQDETLSPCTPVSPMFNRE